ncbi:MAG TPA: DUF885 domain-containing protein [Telluria sp.]|nr:DUF885 domain-containing protein [Telluria sp.]
MMKQKIALALVLAAFALTPAGAATKKKKKKPRSSKPARTVQAKKVAKPVAAPVAQERRADRAFDSATIQFLNALWRIDPESAIAAGKYDTAATMKIPDAASRIARLEFIAEWLVRFGKMKPEEMSTRQRTDHALLVNKLEAERWYLTTFKPWQWNPAMYSVAGPIDYILNTDYAAKPQRLRTLLRRIASVPAYYRAAQENIANPTHEHTRLAIRQAPGNLSVLDDVEKAVQESILTASEKTLFRQRLAAARAAVQGYVGFLETLDQQQLAAGTARPFRIGRELYEQKFALDIQSSRTAEQTYQKALAAREEILTRMDGLADELWPKVMQGVPKPADRYQKIGMAIDRLSTNHVRREDFLDEIRRQIPKLQEFVTSRNLLTLDPSKPLEVRATPAYQRGVAGASIDAPGPYRPQDRTFYNVTPLDDLTPEQAESTLREYNHWMLQVLNIHEAIPGHYAQLMYANRSPSIIKSLFGNGAMVEGWAVYGERMMMEAGYGDATPEMWLMYSKWILRTVTNTILDYSVHVLGMTEPQALDLLQRQAFQTRSQASEKWHRVQVSSVQLTSYFSGYSEIMELREQRKRALGERFNLKEFHEQLLSYGSAPVKMVAELMQ